MSKSSNSLTPKKSARILKANSDVIVIKGVTDTNDQKEFRFKPITPRQQMRRRNSAYKFFSIA